MATRLSSPVNGAYVNGLDQPAKPHNDPPLKSGLDIALDEIPGSVTTDYMLISLNVASGTNADINYGWNLPCLLASHNAITPWTRDHLCKVVSTGVAQGMCKRVWLVIGGATNGPQTDTFTNIQTILTTGGQLATGLLANFGAIFAAIKNINGVEAVGFDMDYEESGDLASTVANVTIALCHHIYGAFNFVPRISFCPSFVSEQQNWIEALVQIYSSKKIIEGQHIQPVVGYNLQCYAGGDGNNPEDWATTIKDAKGTGVTDPDNFVWPIVSCDPDAKPVTPSDKVEQKLKGWKSKGASLWATRPTSGPPPNLKAYSQAIAKGIK